MSRHPVWEIVFLMVIMKIPILYLCLVVYYAIKAEPRPEEGAAVTAQLGGDDSGGGWRRRLRPRGYRPRPHGGPTRNYPRAPRTALARGEAERK
jgi:hypothetical protein